MLKKILKRVVLCIVCVVGVLMLFAFIAPYIIDINSFKPRIVSLVKEHTGRDIEINGPLQVQFFPWLGVKLSDVSFANAEGFAEKNMLTVGKMQASIKVLPLLRKRLEIGYVRINGLTLNYEIDEFGVNNIDDIARHIDNRNKLVNVSSTSENADSSLNLDVKNSNISGIDITNTVINFTDKINNKNIVVKPLNIQTSAVEAGKPISAKVSGIIDGSNPYFHVTVNLNATVSGDTNKITVSDFFGDFSINADNLTGSAQMRTSLVYDIEHRHISSDRLAINLMTKFNNLPEYRIVANAAVDYMLGEGTLRATNINLKSGDLEIKGNFGADNLNESPILTADIATNEFDPRKLMEMLDLAFVTDMADPGLYSTAKIKASYKMENKVMEIPLTLELDRVRASSTTVIDLSGDKLVLTIPLRVNEIDLDRYLFAGNNKGADAEIKSNAPTRIALPNIDLVNVPDMHVHLIADKIKIVNLEPEKINITAKMVNGIAETDNISLMLYDGNVSGSAKMEAIQDNFKAEADLVIKSVDFHRLINSFSPETKTEDLPRRLSLSVQAGVQNNMFRFSYAEVQLDDITVKGRISGNFREDRQRPHIRFALESNDVNLANLIGSSGTDAAEEPGRMSALDMPLPLQYLTGFMIDIDGNFNMSALIVDNISFNNIRSQITMSDGIARVAPLTANMFGGSAQADISVVRHSEDIVQTSTTVSLSNISVGRLISGITGNDSPILTGSLNGFLDTVAVGTTAGEMSKTLNGTLNYSILGGTIHGISYNPNVLSLDMLRTFVLTGDRNRTPIDPVTGSASISNGVMTVERVRANSAFINAEIRGTIDFAKQEYDLLGRLRLEGGAGIRAPYTITGRLGSPEFDMDMGALRTELIFQLTRSTGLGILRTPKNVLERIENKVEGGLDSLIRDR